MEDITVTHEEVNALTSSGDIVGLGSIVHAAMQQGIKAAQEAARKASRMEAIERNIARQAENPNEEPTNYSLLAVGLMTSALLLIVLAPHIKKAAHNIGVRLNLVDGRPPAAKKAAESLENTDEKKVPLLEEYDPEKEKNTKEAEAKKQKAEAERQEAVKKHEEEASKKAAVEQIKEDARIADERKKKARLRELDKRKKNKNKENIYR